MAVLLTAATFLADVCVALHDILERRVVDSARIRADEARLEDHLRAWKFQGLALV